MAENPGGEVSAKADFLAGGGEMGERIRAYDWARTPLGPMESWSPSLKMMVRFLLANRFPMLLWWGPQFIQIYNDPYRPVLGAKHPSPGLGQPVSVCWSEIWDVLRPLIETPYRGGSATWMDDILLLINRYGFDEETHFTVAYSAVPDDSVPGGIGGVLATVNEITDKVVAERRLTALRDLGARVGEAKSAREVCRLAAEVLGQHDKDIPFVMFYLVEGDGTRAQLAGGSGTVRSEDFSPAIIDLAQPASGGWPVAQVLASGAAQTVSGLRKHFVSVPAGPWANPPETAVVMPIFSGKAKAPFGVMIAGVSSRLRFDGFYRDFLELLRTQVATAITNARAYDEERRRAESLAELDRTKTEFFSNISHEFRTPLTLMLGPVEELLQKSDPPLPEAAHAQLEVVHRNSLRLLKLVNTLLEFSRIEAGRMQAEFTPVDLAAFTAELASVFRSAIEHAGLRLVIDCPPLPETITVDRDMWEKIVLNLLSNAFKYTLAGEIAVSLRPAGDRVQLSVRDTGVGIPAAELPRLFERFHRVRHAKGRTHEGTGIGLALVQELVHLHGGTIRAESVVDQGTTFFVEIPVALTASETVPLEKAPDGPAAPPKKATTFEREALRWLPPGPETKTPRPASAVANPAPGAASDLPGRPRILWAEDNADMRDYVARLLAAEFEVESVADGQAALEAARAHPPELVLTDLMMPRLDGLGLLRELRADPALAPIPVILLSARAGEEARVDGVGSGADDYLTKPFSARELLARVEAHVKLFRTRRRAEAAIRESEERFRALLTAGAYVVYRMSPDWSEMTTLDGQGFLTNITQPTRNWLEEFIPPDEQPLVRRTIAAAIAARGIFELEHRVRSADGSTAWTLSRAVPLIDAQGKIREWFGAATDVTARKEAEFGLRASEARLRQRTAQFETLLNQAPLGVYVVDADLRMWEMNPVASEIFRGSPAPLGQKLADLMVPLIPADEIERVLARFRHTLDTGESCAIPEVIATPPGGGGSAYIEWRIDRIPLPDGRYGVVCYFRDISAQVKTRLTIAESAERYRSIVSVVTDVPWIANAEAEFFEPQPAWEAYTGQPWAQHRGRGWIEAVHPDDRERLMAEWRRAQRELTRFETAGRFWHAGTREWRHFVVKAAPLFHSDGRLREWVGSCTDDENRIRNEHELKRARDEALAANRAKDEFLAMLSHELRTPLNPVLLIASEAAGDLALPAPVRTDFRMIADNVALQARLIDDLLDLNRITRGKIALERSALDLHEVLRSAVTTMGEDIRAHRIELTLRLSAPEASVDGDPVRLRQVFWNVLKNAVKFTPEGGSIAITSAVLPGTREIEVRIADSGIGMEPDELKRIFHPFVQGRHAVPETETHSGYGGLGLGLAISRMLVEVHGGSIRAESAGAQRGSAITVRLPLRAAVHGPAGNNGDRNGHGSAAPALPAVAPNAATAHRILFVEDHAPTRAAMVGLLKRRGYNVTPAQSMTEAITHSQEEKFDLLISDIGLPDGDGCSLMTELRRDQPALPGIAISGYGMEEDLSRSRAAGFEEHLTKPISIDSLERALGRLLTKHFRSNGDGEGESGR